MSYVAIFQEVLKAKLPRPISSDEKKLRTSAWFAPSGWTSVFPQELTRSQAETVLANFADEILIRRSSAAERELLAIAKSLQLSDELQEALRHDPTVLLKELHRQLDEISASCKRLQESHKSYAKKFRYMFFLLNNKKIQWKRGHKRPGYVHTTSHSVSS